MDAVHINSLASRVRTKETPPRTTYRHGDLRRALLDAGLQLARLGGPEAVVLREATRRAGVVPNAAYRHFASRMELLQAVRGQALAEVAMAMRAEIGRRKPSGDAAEDARAMLRAIGASYMRFAQRETGLFRTAFSSTDPAEEPGLMAAAAQGDDMRPFLLLGQALDRMVQAGVLPPERRPDAEFFAWSAVHGMALLIIDGPLRHVGAAQVHALGERLIDMVERGL